MNWLDYIAEFRNIIDLLGTLAFAISGIRLASQKQMDWFGAYIIGLVTAIGGGTVRDLLLGVTPFWMMQESYVIVTGVALFLTVVWQQKIFKLGQTLFLFDTIGLGLFTMVGVMKTEDLGFPIWVCIAMGTITGSVGGVLRDVLINEVPLLFRKDIYALTSVAGGSVYFLGKYLQFSSFETSLVGAVVIIVLRLLVVKFHWQLPVLKINQ